MAKTYTKEQRLDMEQNFYKSVHYKDHVDEKSLRTIGSYEWDWMWPRNMSFGYSIWQAYQIVYSSCFVWEGLPETIDPEIMELYVVQSGVLAGVKVGSEVYMVHAAPERWDHQGNYKKARIVEPFLPGLNGKQVEDFEHVYLKNNSLGQSLIRIIYPFLKTLDDTIFNLDAHQSILAGKYVYVSDAISKKGDNKENENSLSQWISNGKPVKEFKKQLMSDGKLPLLKLEVEDYTDSFIQVIKECETYIKKVLGLPSNSVESKKERVNTEEISVQQAASSNLAQNMLAWRQKFADEINEKFGLNVKVRLRDVLDFENMEDETEEVEDELSQT